MRVKHRLLRLENRLLRLENRLLRLENQLLRWGNRLLRTQPKLLPSGVESKNIHQPHNTTIQQIKTRKYLRHTESHCNTQIYRGLAEEAAIKTSIKEPSLEKKRAGFYRKPWPWPLPLPSPSHSHSHSRSRSRRDARARAIFDNPAAFPATGTVQGIVPKTFQWPDSSRSESRHHGNADSEKNQARNSFSFQPGLPEL